MSIRVNFVCDDAAYAGMVARPVPPSLTVYIFTREDALRALDRGETRALLIDERACTAAFESELRRRAKFGMATAVVLLRHSVGDPHWPSWCSRSLTIRDLRANGAAQLRRELIRALRRAVTSHAARAGRPPSLIEDVVAALLTSKAPIKSIAELEVLLGYDRRDMSIAWKGAMRAATQLSLAEFVRVVVLLLAMERKGGNEGWRHLMKGLRSRPDRLGRISAKIFGMSLQEAADQRFDEVIALVESTVVRLLGVDEVDLWRTHADAG